jgi:hypothetical protein
MMHACFADCLYGEFLNAELCVFIQSVFMLNVYAEYLFC